jgi:integrase
MPISPAIRTPRLRRHKPSSRAVVTLSGRDIYCGPWPQNLRKPPPEVREEYDRVVSEWLANGRRLADEVHAEALTVSDIVERFWSHAELHYRRADGTSTSELADYRMSFRPLIYLYGDLAAAQFGPLKLKAVRQLMVDGYQHPNPKYDKQPPLARGVVNQRIGRIVRLFKWCVAEELVAAEVYHGLQALCGLQHGRTKAHETEPVRPVADSVVDAVLPFVSDEVSAMIRLQRLSGMRPGEVVMMRGIDLDCTGPIWLYKPVQHKLAYRGKTRVICLGPRAIEIVKPFLRLDLSAFLFSPKEAAWKRQVRRRAKRKSKVQPSQVSRKVKRPQIAPGDHYSVWSYGRAISRACALADVPHWAPNQLRHSLATQVRKRFGLEAAQVSLGHSQASITQVYAERDQALAVKVAEAIG